MHSSIVIQTALDTALRAARLRGASDWHWSPLRQWLRIEGDLLELENELAWNDLRGALSEDQLAWLAQGHGVDMAWTDVQGGRYRLQVCLAHEGVALTARIIQSALPDAMRLGIPHAALEWMRQRHGLVLIAGATGSGKSSSLVALLLHRVSQWAQHVVTLEDPVEWILQAKGSRFTQRSLGRHCSSYAEGVRAALRQDPDVIAIGELRDTETARWALLAAQTGHLVIASVHAQDAAQTVQRIVSLFGAEEQGRMRQILAQSLNGVLVQELHQGRDGKRKAAFEVMSATGAIKALIREDRIAQIPGVIETSAAGGMISMTQSRRSLQIGSVRSSSL